MATVPVLYFPLSTGGLQPLNWARNGVLPSGPETRTLADYINFLLGRRLRHISTNGITNSDSPDFSASQDNTTFRFRTHLSPNASAVRIRMVLIPTDQPGGVNYTTPKGWWTITNKDTSTIVYDDGTSGTDRSFLFDTRIATVDTVVPNNFSEITRTYSGLTGGQDHTFELHQKDGLRILTYSAYEVIRTSLDTSTETAVDATKFREGDAIYNREVLDLLAGIEAAWKQLGTNHIAWSVPGTTAKTMTGTTETNLFDGSTTGYGWSSTGAGFPLTARYHDSEDTRIAATYSVPARFYVYASATGGGTGTVTFRYGTGASNWYAAVTGITTAGWYAVTDKYLNGNTASAHVAITGTGSTAGTTVNLFAAGCYDYSA